jgi:hypothetical protein
LDVSLRAKLESQPEPDPLLRCRPLRPAVPLSRCSVQSWLRPNVGSVALSVCEPHHTRPTLACCQDVASVASGGPPRHGPSAARSSGQRCGSRRRRSWRAGPSLVGPPGAGRSIVHDANEPLPLRAAAYVRTNAVASGTRDTSCESSARLAYQSARSVDLLRTQRPDSLAQAALLTRAATHGPQYPARSGRTYHLQSHAALVLRNLLPDLPDAHNRHVLSIPPRRSVSRGFTRHWLGPAHPRRANCSPLHRPSRRTGFIVEPMASHRGADEAERRRPRS